MQVIHNITELRAWRAQQQNVALVPTMGNLHAGHLALVRQAHTLADQVVVSIFVNPLQFGVNEDYARYPRTLAHDAELLRDTANIIFAPSVEMLFPTPQTYHIEPPALADMLCGEFRPGHFRGVATIVMKLFNIVQPTLAVFGKKDYQQLAVIRGMVADFASPVELIAGDTVRAEDGLALSSRNGFLSPDERNTAPQLYATLLAIKNKILSGEDDFKVLERHAYEQLTANGWHVDYVAIRNAALQLADHESKRLIILAAAYLGQTRLIDNLEIER